jgi:hypothetical protein
MCDFENYRIIRNRRNSAEYYYWNPLNTKIVYLHFTRNENEDTYLKVDTEQQRVYVVRMKDGKKRGVKNLRGLYEIKWISFISGYTHTFKYHGTGMKSYLGNEIAHGAKVTTQAQYEAAKQKLIATF